MNKWQLCWRFRANPCRLNLSLVEKKQIVDWKKESYLHSTKAALQSKATRGGTRTMPIGRQHTVFRRVTWHLTTAWWTRAAALTWKYYFLIILFHFLRISHVNYFLPLFECGKVLLIHVWLVTWHEQLVPSIISSLNQKEKVQ